MNFQGMTFRGKGVLQQALLCLLLLAVVGSVAAAPIPFKRDPVRYDLSQEKLPDFLSRFFTDQGLNVVLSEAVLSQEGTLNGPRSGTPQQVFRSIGNSNQLLAYYDGATVYVYKSSERESRDFALTSGNVERFVRAFFELKLGDENNSFTASPETGIVLVTGAQRFIEQAEVLANSLGGASANAVSVFKYMPLRYAWASDTTMTVGNRQVVVPGVATILRQLMGLDQRGGNPQQGRRETVLRPSAERLRGQGLDSIGDPQGVAGSPDGGRLWLSSDVFPEDDRPPGTDDRAVDFPQPAPAANADTQIVADPYRNAIIVRDHPDRIALYEELIASLDSEPQIVEIEATIIDVDKNRLKDVGVNWRWQNSNSEAVFGPAGTKDDFLPALLGNRGEGNIDLLRPLPGLSLGGIIGDSSRFIARINLLAEDGITNIVSRPQVVTLNDVEAVIENSQTVYVPVGGAYEVDLFNVIAGTILRVTPHVVVEEDRSRIRMVVAVEDGGVSFESSRVQRTEFPVVTRNAVSTQAIITEGESLLVGGLVRDRSINSTDKVPGLGDIPLLGRVFRSTQRQRDRTERLFLITPRLLTTNRITSQETPSTPAVDVDQLEEADALRERSRRGRRG